VTTPLKKILWGRDAICDALQVSKEGFYKLLQEGLPARKRAGRWAAHVDDLEAFFRTDRDAGPGTQRR